MLMRIRMTARRQMYGWTIAFAGSSILLVLATLPGFVGADLRSMLMLGFSGVCHQIAERSPHLGGVQLAVCHRCYGIYVALPIAALSFPILRRMDTILNRFAPVLICLAVLVPGVDWMGDVVGLWSNTAISRLVTGAFFGIISGYFLSRALTDLFRRDKGAPLHAPAASSSGE